MSPAYTDNESDSAERRFAGCKCTVSLVSNQFACMDVL